MANVRGGGNGKVGVMQAFRDVAIASMRYGQFPYFILFVILAIAFWRMPGGDVSKMMFLIVEYLRQGYLIGYVLFFGALVGWFYHARYQRRLINPEMDRIAEEKSKLQKKSLGDGVESSVPAKRGNKKKKED